MSGAKGHSRNESRTHRIDASALSAASGTNQCRTTKGIRAKLDQHDAAAPNTPSIWRGSNTNRFRNCGPPLIPNPNLFDLAACPSIDNCPRTIATKDDDGFYGSNFLLVVNILILAGTFAPDDRYGVLCFF